MTAAWPLPQRGESQASGGGTCHEPVDSKWRSHSCGAGDHCCSGRLPRLLVPADGDLKFALLVGTGSVHSPTTEDLRLLEKQTLFL